MVVPVPPPLLRAADRALRPAAGRLPWWALLETLGRRTGRPHRVPVSDGCDGDTCWLVAEHGPEADWVRNVAARPLVRLRTGGAWRAGVATARPDDDVASRLARLPAVNAMAIRALGRAPTSVRVDLERPASRHPDELAVDGIVAAAPATVFAFLADLGNHDWIGDRNLDVVGLHRDGATTTGADLELRRPGLPTLAATTVVEQRRPAELLAGRVEVPGVATATIAWELAALGGGTRVRLRTRPVSMRARDRLWWAAGGRAWLADRLDAVLVRLAGRLAETTGP